MNTILEISSVLLSYDQGHPIINRSHCLVLNSLVRGDLRNTNYTRNFTLSPGQTHKFFVSGLGELLTMNYSKTLKPVHVFVIRMY